jgi:hypothetical protein
MQSGARPYNRVELQNHIDLILKLHPLQDPKDREFIKRLRYFIEEECGSLETIYFTPEEEERFYDIMCVTSDAEYWHTDCASQRGRPFVPSRIWGRYPRNWWMITSDTAH